MQSKYKKFQMRIALKLFWLLLIPVFLNAKNVPSKTYRMKERVYALTA